MKRWMVIVAALALVLAWFGLKDVLWRASLSGMTSQAVRAPDYDSGQDWLARPEVPPVAVWQAGWDLDVVLVPPRSSVGSGPGEVSLDDVKARRSIDTKAGPLVGILSSAGPVYAPRIRAPSPFDREGDWSLAVTDFEAALEHYLAYDNHGRAFALAVPEDAAPLGASVWRMRGGMPETIQARFVGLIALGTSGHDPADLPLCGDDAVPCQLVLAAHPRSHAIASLRPSLPGQSAALVIDDPVAADQALIDWHAGMLAHLENAVARPAEPIGDTEIVDIAPIRRPGEATESDRE